MKKVIQIEGMHCEHCQAKAESALNRIPGVTAKVNLKKNQAAVTMDTDISEDVFRDALEAVDFKLVSMTEKKGWRI